MEGCLVEKIDGVEKRLDQKIEERIKTTNENMQAQFAEVHKNMAEMHNNIAELRGDVNELKE